MGNIALRLKPRPHETNSDSDLSPKKAPQQPLSEYIEVKPSFEVPEMVHKSEMAIKRKKTQLRLNGNRAFQTTLNHSLKSASISNINTPSKVRTEIRALERSMQNFKILSSLDIDISKKDSRNMNRLLLSLKHLTSLSKLTIRLQINSDNNSYLARLLYLRIKDLNLLSNLALYFTRKPQIPNEYEDELALICWNIRYLYYLSSLTIGFFQIPNLGKATKSLSISLRNLTSLASLALHFDTCQSFDADTIANLSTCLSHLSSLSSLVLDFSICENLTSKHMHSLLESIKSLKSLKVLRIKLNHCREIDSETLHSLQSVLQSLTSLSSLGLDFHACCKITENGALKLLTSLEQVKSLSVLSLDFRSCEGIGNKAIESLSTTLEGLTSLVKVSLYFSGCNQIDDSGVKRLSSSLGHLSVLSDLTLHFNHCYRITYEEVERLLLGRLNPLMDVHFELYRNNNWGQCVIEEAAMKFKSEPKLAKIMFNNLRLN